MQHRRLGKSDINASAVGLGTWVTGGWMWGVHGLTLGQLAIAWTLAQPGCTHALVGAHDASQAQENARAGDVNLSPDDLAAMARALQAHGPFA